MNRPLRSNWNTGKIYAEVMDTPCFVTDIYLPQMLYARTIRSPVAKGRLKFIECPKLSGSYTLINATHIPGKNFLDDSLHPILAGEHLSYIGEPVALLLGPDKNTLEEYAQDCHVIIAEEETPVFIPDKTNADCIAAKRDIRVGDPETAFANAASVVQGTYTTGIQEHWYAEPTGAIAWLPESAAEKGDHLVVRTATQWPFHVRRSVAQVLGLAASNIMVKPTITGLHMDGKLWYPSLVSCHAALGAWITKRPVRLILNRGEDFFFSPKRCETEINIASALDEKGEITGIEINTTVNLGAHDVNALEILDHVNLGSIGVYKAKNIRLSSVALRTNIPPQGPYAGFGLAQGFFAMERHVSRIADTLKQDPAQWRFENGIKSGILSLGLPVKDSVTVQQLIQTVVKTSDYHRKWASYELLRQDRRPEMGESLRGIGIALGYQGNGLLYHGCDKGAYSIEMILEKDGTLDIKTSINDSSGDYGNIWAGIASNILGVNREMVRIHSDIESLDTGPLTMSRAITVVTRLVEQACVAISKKRFRDPLPINVRKTIRPQKNPAWDECFSSPQAPDSNGFAHPGWASAIVEVEIDPIEYLSRIRGVWMGVDGGSIISTDRACKSLKESAVQALGWVYREQVKYINGVIPASQQDNFEIPATMEIPSINIEFIRNEHSGPKGIGDLPYTCIPAAYMQAVSQAMDSYFQSIPLKDLDIWYAAIRRAIQGETI